MIMCIVYLYICSCVHTDTYNSCNKQKGNATQKLSTTYPHTSFNFPRLSQHKNSMCLDYEAHNFLPYHWKQAHILLHRVDSFPGSSPTKGAVSTCMLGSFVQLIGTTSARVLLYPQSMPHNLYSLT